MSETPCCGTSAIQRGKHTIMELHSQNAAIIDRDSEMRWSTSAYVLHLGTCNPAHDISDMHRMIHDGTSAGQLGIDEPTAGISPAVGPLHRQNTA